ncbi:hypothetical protein MMC21_006033 [Puttea exsequens]|nr:hypothetical protein [Puttea exsequens]
MDGNGNCPADFKKKCISYCEVRQEFYYGVEQPLDNPYCHGPLTCTVGSNKATTYTFNSNVNVKWLEALGLGITGGFSSASSTTDVRSTSVKLDEGKCGYFTFLPILHGSCGTVSEGKQLDVPINHCINYQSTGNVCTQQPYRSSDGTLVLGDTVFVKTDCGTRERLPLGEQDPAYQHDGVAAPQSVYTTFADAYDCVLSDECQHPWGYAINPSCVCTCAGQIAPLHSAGCQGFLGSLPDPPPGGPGNGP